MKRREEDGTLGVKMMTKKRNDPDDIKVYFR